MHPKQARALLVAHPQVAYALLQALLLDNIVDQSILSVSLFHLLFRTFADAFRKFHWHNPPFLHFLHNAVWVIMSNEWWNNNCYQKLFYPPQSPNQNVNGYGIHGRSEDTAHVCCTIERLGDIRVILLINFFCNSRLAPLVGINKDWKIFAVEELQARLHLLCALRVSHFGLSPETQWHLGCLSRKPSIFCWQGHKEKPR